MKDNLHAERLVLDRRRDEPVCGRGRDGTGNSPPARKLAVSPESATSVGSASRRTRALRFERGDQHVYAVALVDEVGEDDAEGPRAVPPRCRRVWNEGNPAGVVLGAVALLLGMKPPCRWSRRASRLRWTQTNSRPGRGPRRGTLRGNEP